MQTTLGDWEGQLPQQPLSPESDFRATRPSIVLEKSSDEIQRQHQVDEMEANARGSLSEQTHSGKIPTKVGDSLVKLQSLPAKSINRKHEAVVQKENGRATVWSCCPQLQQPLQQQSPQCQLQSGSIISLRNDYNPLLGVNLNKKTYKNLFSRICEYDNLLLAYEKASQGKPKNSSIREFGKELVSNLYALQRELQTGIYRPRQLKTFTVRDPKTRKISASNPRDRVVHHALCNLLYPIFEKRFIFDSFANRKGKGTKAILERFDTFSHKFKHGYALKADIRHYFDTIDQAVLLQIINKRIKDERVMQLIESILKNHKTEYIGKGMPLGNQTSQVFANIYLAELDNFVKHELRAKYYLRYVDDFILLSNDKTQLEVWQKKIQIFLDEKLHLQLHPDKTRVVPLAGGVSLVGLRVFRHHKLLKKSNTRRIWKRLAIFKQRLAEGKTTKKHIQSSMAGWDGYAKSANTFRLRKRINNEVNSICKGGI